MTKLAFEPHKITQDRIKALQDNVLVADMEFDTRLSRGGIIIPNDNGTSLGIRPRWGRVYAVGPKQTDVTVGQWIMVAHGRWTRGIDIDDGTTDHKVTIRKIDPKDILLVSDEPDRPLDDTHSDAVYIPNQTKD
jgi:co-chaperonin GroES (HSP10)